MRTKLYSFSTRLITVVLGLVSLLLIALLAAYLQEQIAMQADALIRSSLRWKFLFAAGLLVVGLIVLFKLLRRIPLFPCVLFVAAAALSMAAAAYLRTELQSDFLFLYRSAVQLRHGDLSFANNVYFYLWGYQSVYVAWEAALLSLWEDPRMIQLVHCLLFSGSLVLLYRLMRTSLSEQAARIAAVLPLLFPFFFTLPSVLTNQIPSAFFFLLGLWCLVGQEMRQRGRWRFALGGALLQLGNLLRPEGVLVLAALAAVGILYLLSHHEQWKRLAVAGLLVLAAYFLVGRLAELLAVWTGLNPAGLGNRSPLWKFLIGFNHETGGSYSDADWQAVLSTLSPTYKVTDATLELERSLIAQRLQQPLGAFWQLFLHKVENLWVKGGLYWALNRYLERWALLYSIVTWYDRLVLLAGVCLTGVGVVLGWKQKRPAVQYLPQLMVLAAFFAFLLVEVQPRYSYLPDFFLFWCAGYGAEELLTRRQNRKERR